MAVSEGELVQAIISLLQTTGTNGGMVSPSIYDTAQILLLHSPERAQPLIGWLQSQQRGDGGWFDPVTPYIRDTPTLAAILALAAHSYDHHCMKAVERGLAFLASHDSVWEGSYLPEDIPVAAELVLPALLDRAFSHVHIPERSYKTLRMLGLARLALIRRFKPAAGTAPSHALSLIHI